MAPIHLDTETLLQPMTVKAFGIETSATELVNESLDSALSIAELSYVSRYPASRLCHERAVKVLPGGNTRSVLHTDPFPICMKRGRGNRVWDQDGFEYLDLVGELTAGLYGHSNPILKRALASAYEECGISLGASSEQEIKLAELLCQRFSSLEQVRFCNSGTEANIFALSVARHMSGKRKTICFEGAYHGSVLGFGHGVAKNNVDPSDWILCRYNDTDNFKHLIRNTPDVAAVIVEAMQGAGGCIPAKEEFLRTIQETAKECGVYFILDEVMTSRLHPGGLQGKYSLDPDLTTLGKYIGGGLSFGAFGGKKSLLAAYDPKLPTSLPHSGTFNNNMLTMSCGFTGLSEIYTAEVAKKINALGDSLRAQLHMIAQGTKMVITGVGAVMTIHFLADGKLPQRTSEIEEQNVRGLKKLFWYWCLENGIWITERGMLSLILETSQEDLSGFVEVVRSFVERYLSFLRL